MYFSKYTSNNFSLDSKDNKYTTKQSIHLNLLRETLLQILLASDVRLINIDGSFVHYEILQLNLSDLLWH